MDYEINNNENQLDSENNQIQDLYKYFKVSPDGYYTESDTKTIINFNEDDETKTQIQIEEENHPQNNEYENQEEYESQKIGKNHENYEKEEIKFKKQNQGEEDEEIKENHKNKDQENIQENENHEDEEEQHNNENKQEGQEQGIQERNQEKKEEKENVITDPNIKQLMKMDLSEKEGIIDLLMKENLVKKLNVKKQNIIKEKNKSKFENVESTIGKKPIGNQKTSYGRKGFQIVPNEGDPEFIKDINIAAYAIKDQLEKENQDIAKILFKDDSLKKINKRITRDQIGQKVKKILERKKI